MGTTIKNGVAITHLNPNTGGGSFETIRSTSAEDTPAGITWASGGTTITGTLAASASTAGKIYFVPNGSVFDQYISIDNGDGFVWSKAGATALQSEDIATSLTPSSTDAEAAGAKAAYDAIFPTPVTSMPAGGFKADTVYDLGELTGNINFLLADGVAGKRYCWAFETPSTLPAVAFPSGIKWSNDASHAEVMPELASSMRYEVSIVDGYALISEFDLISEDE